MPCTHAVFALVEEPPHPLFKNDSFGQEKARVPQKCKDSGSKGSTREILMMMSECTLLGCSACGRSGGEFELKATFCLIGSLPQGWIEQGKNQEQVWYKPYHCGKCFNWRLIPTEEEFEEIRSKFTVDPFICSKIPNVSCDDPADIERDESRTWVIHKPDVPKTPAGFKRTLIMRRDFSKMDCYYEAPNGKRFRTPADVSKFLDKFPKYKKDISTADFSFTSPKIMDDTIPAAVGKKVVI